MTWFEREFLKNDITLTLKGEYHPPEDQSRNIIEIILLVGGEEYIIFEHNPSMRYDENPPPESVYAKYAAKVRKYTQFIAENTVEDILNKFRK